MSVLTDLAHGTEPDVAVAKEVIRHLVQRFVFCPVSGHVLDVRTTVLVEVFNATTGAKVGQQVIHKARWEAYNDAFQAECESRGWRYDIHDGSLLFNGKGR